MFDIALLGNLIMLAGDYHLEPLSKPGLVAFDIGAASEPTGRLLDLDFEIVPATDPFHPGGRRLIAEALLATDDALLLGGGFRSVGGRPRFNYALLVVDPESPAFGAPLDERADSTASVEAIETSRGLVFVAGDGYGLLDEVELDAWFAAGQPFSPAIVRQCGQPVSPGY